VLSKFFGSWARSRGGSINIIFVLAFPAVIGFFVLAVEVHNIHTAKAVLHDALDSATLAAARARVDNEAERDTIATAFLRENIPARYKPYVGPVDISGSTDTSFIGVTRITYPLIMSAVTGMGSIDIEQVTHVKAAPDGNLELALVLDTTGSMQGSRMAALKAAAKDLTDIVMDDDKVKVAVVPFAVYVNVGVANRNLAGLSVMADEPDEKICETKDKWKSVDCKEIDSTCDKWKCEKVTKECDGPDNTKYTCTVNDCKKVGEKPCKKQQCDWVKDGTYEDCYTNWGNKWQGCVGSREYPLNIQDQDPGVGIPGVWGSCSKQLQRLTTSKSSVQSTIAGLSADDNTYIAAGLMWGWRAISHRVPLPDGANPGIDKKTRKAIVLMTDGENTRVKNVTGPYHNASDTSRSNAYLSELCSNVKNDEITMYTVAFEVTDSTIKDLLKDCATDPSMFFDAKNSSDLKKAFSDIADQLNVIYISK
jgi:Flp pilus assembly protein TadG